MSRSNRRCFFGSTSNAARNILEDLGLVTFVAIVGINAGASLLAQLTGAVALKIFLVGFIASTVPPLVTWALGYHLFKVVGFPVGYAVSGVLLTVFGYFAMVL